ncbi:unnamed protein product [Mycetohabitans rhizoxinica HKI 454]|uniref:Uncharacterized protein n=1 Tax=Mycetohabitans rhizoxinica (strain DSM 19002 / CIP 109453 / HKI 454) TaxID=882378 RepID=E5AQS4_MYCRK|nr:unnamed protein product [Mycetohabitans rhizoxinica HKI 454]
MQKPCHWTGMQTLQRQPRWPAATAAGMHVRLVVYLNTEWPDKESGQSPITGTRRHVGAHRRPIVHRCTARGTADSLRRRHGGTTRAAQRHASSAYDLHHCAHL